MDTATGRLLDVVPDRTARAAGAAWPPRSRPATRGAGDRAWQLKETTRDLDRAADVEAAREVLELLYVWADTGHVPEMRRFAGTLRRWDTRCWPGTSPAVSNGPRS